MPRKKAAAKKPQRAWNAGFLAAVAIVAGAGLAVSVWFALRDGGGSPDPTAEYTGTESVGGVEVLRPSVDLGRAPLDVPVSHTFVITNTNDRPVELGKAQIKVLDGC